MPKRVANFHVHRPPKPTEPHAWAVQITPRGKRRLLYMPTVEIETDADHAQARLARGHSVCCGKAIWDGVYAWWEGSHEAHHAVA